MTRMTLAALITLFAVTTAGAQIVPYFPSAWPQPGSFDGAGVETPDDPED